MTSAVRVLAPIVEVRPHEVKALLLAFACNFVLLGVYYILRPLRDAMGTVFGVERLQELFTGTFVLTLLAAPFYAWAASRMKLSRFLPGVFWFLLADLLVFYGLFRVAPQSRWLAAAFFWWFSVINLILVSVFWTLMADVFSPRQATRLFAFIAAGGSTGAIFGPIVTKALVGVVGVDGLIFIAAAGFAVVILLTHRLMRAKVAMVAAGEDAQRTSLAHALPGDPLRGFVLLLKSPYLMGQAMFMLLMTMVATAVYLLQTDFIAKAYAGVADRTVAFADIDLLVNAVSAVILIFGLGRVLQRFGVTASLVLSPLIMIACCAGVAIWPGFLMVQTARAAQRVSQYAVARPSREVLFTVVDQQEKYKAKNVIDTVVYRFGDLAAAWMQAGLRSAGFGLLGAVTVAIGLSAAWAGVAVMQGRRYEALKRAGAGGEAPIDYAPAP